MELQQRRFSCGPSAVRAALYVLGHNATEAALRRHAGTTPEGTDERGIMRAFSHYGHKTKEYQSESLKKSWNWLKNTIGRGKPALLCVDQWDHWVAVVGRLGGKLLVFDPDSSGGRRKKYSGLQVVNEHELGLRWRYAGDPETRPCYYGVAVTT